MNWREIQAIGRRLTPALRRALVAAFRRAQGRLTTGDLVRLLEAGGASPAQIADVLPDLAALVESATRPAIQTATTRAAALARADLAGAMKLTRSFILVNPQAVRVAQRQIAELVTRVSIETRQAIRTIIATSIREGIAPRDAARLIRPTIGLNARQAQAVVHFRARLQAAGAAEDAIAAAAEKYAARLLRQRALMIARTETIDALVRGQQATWAEAQRRGFLGADAEQVWITTDDEKLCPYCEPMEGKTARVGEMFDTPLGPKSGPPAHPHCRCSVGIRSVGPARRAA